MGKKTLIPVMSLQNISIRFFDSTVFHNLTWQIHQGECWAVLGDTGSGKSVLVRALCGELPVSGGEISYNFKKSNIKPCDDEPEKRISYVSFDLNRELKSDENLFVQSRYWSNAHSLTVEQYLSKENVYEINPFQIGSDCIDSDKYCRLRKQILDLLQINQLLAHEVNMLSNGECRKIVMARALLKEPALLILDNPFQGLDPSYREYFCSTVLPSLQMRGIHTILVSNESDHIPAIVTHILYIDSFKVVASGPRDLINSCLQVSALPNEIQIRNALIKFFSLKRSKKKNIDTCIKMSDVSVRYGRKKILQDLSWVVKKGENWAVLGPNGSGKTTLLSLVLGDHPQVYANDIEILGMRWGRGINVWDIKKRIGWVSPELHICYPPEEKCINVLLSGFFDSIGLFQRYSSQKRKIAKELFTIFNLSNIENDPFGSVSEGVQRLVLLMRAIVKVPELLILDEPCQGLPSEYRKLIISIIDTIAGHYNCTVIFVTHQLDELPSCITDVMNLQSGRTQA